MRQSFDPGHAARRIVTGAATAARRRRAATAAARARRRHRRRQGASRWCCAGWRSATRCGATSGCRAATTTRPTIARVAAMGMNAVRFYMNYRTFEADAAPGNVPGRRLAVAGRQHRVGQAPRRLPDPEHARPAGRLSVAGRRQGAVGSARHAGAADRAVDRDRAPLQGRADGRRLRPAERAGGDARQRASGTTWPARIAAGDPHRRSRSHAVRRAPERDRGRLDRGRATATSSASPTRTPSTSSTSTSRSTSRTRARRGCRSRPRTSRYPDRRAPRSSGSCSIARPAPRRARSCRPATARGRSIRARRSRSTIRRSSSASRCWSSSANAGQGVVRRSRCWSSSTPPARSSA